MPKQKSNSAAKAKAALPRFSPADKAKAWSFHALEQLFGLAQGWEKHRDIVDNNFTLGCHHLAAGHVRDAIFRFKIVTWLNPKHAGAWTKLGSAYMADGKKAEAKTALVKALQLQPGNAEAHYMFALASDGKLPKAQQPTSIPLELSRTYFDRLAPGFTQMQLETYRYQGHTLLCNAIRAQLTPGRIDHMILELGVGTGLCGPLLRDVTAQLTGVDISGAMLEEAMKRQDAQGKKIYDVLIKRDIAGFLSEALAASADVVLAAGVFSYVGALDEIMAQASRVLKQGGLCAFTADTMEGDGFQLDAKTARFQFSRAYLEGLATRFGFHHVACELAPIYPQYEAWLCLFKKAA